MHHGAPLMCVEAMTSDCHWREIIFRVLSATLSQQWRSMANTVDFCYFLERGANGAGNNVVDCTTLLYYED